MRLLLLPRADLRPTIEPLFAGMPVDISEAFQANDVRTQLIIVDCDALSDDEARSWLARAASWSTRTLAVSQALDRWPLLLRSGALDVLRLPEEGARLVARVRAWLSEDQGAALPDDQALRRSEERFAKVFRASPVGICITRMSDGTFLDVNERFEQLTGYTRAELLGRSGLELGLWDEPAARGALYEAVRTGSGARNVAAWMRKRALERREVLISAEPVEMAGEACLLALMDDVTEQRQLEEQLRHAQKMEALGRLAGGVAHDFNNILTAIRGYSELLLEQLPAGSIGRRGAEHIRRSAQRAASLTDQLLLFTRKQPAEPKVVALSSVVRQIAILLRPTIGADVALELRLCEGPSFVRVDPSQIEQVILNLAINARDAMPHGGALAIATAPVTDAAGTRWIELTVSDTGHGISDDVRSRMFEPFFTTREVGKGTGLGLAIVYGVVERSGGTITVETAPGQGALFRVRLPAVESVEHPSQSPAPLLPAPPRGNEAVLVVEDDEDVRAFVQQALERAGYEVVVASDGTAALALAERRSDIELLLTDMVMPNLDGVQLAEALRRRSRTEHGAAKTKSLRVLFMSGYPGNVSRASDTTGFLQKPFSADELVRKVRAVLDDPTADAGPHKIR